MKCETCGTETTRALVYECGHQHDVGYCETCAPQVDSVPGLCRVCMESPDWLAKLEKIRKEDSAEFLKKYSFRARKAERAATNGSITAREAIE